MVQRRFGGDQRAHDLDMAEMGGGDQRGAIVGAGDRARIAAAFERDLEHLEVVVHGRDGDDVVALGVERVRIGAEPDERVRRRVLAQKRRDMQRGAAVGVLDVRFLARGDQLLDLGDVAARCCVVQAGIDAQLPLARRGLRGPRRAASSARNATPSQPCAAGEETDVNADSRRSARYGVDSPMIWSPNNVRRLDVIIPGGGFEGFDLRAATALAVTGPAR